MKILLYLIPLILFSCQLEKKAEIAKPALTEGWPESLEKIIIYCSSDEQTIEVNKDNYKKKQDCQDLPGASAIKPIFKGENLNLRVMAQVTQHVTLMNEGPHVDLTEWKGNRSNQKELKEDPSTNRYNLKHDAIFPPFPSFTNEELVEAVKAKLKTWGGEIDNRWIDLAKKCGTEIDKYPCGLGPSEYQIKLEFPKESTFFELSIAVPMGC